MGDDDFVVWGARTHNLKNVNVRIPHGRWVAFTGPSGSGKSSLAVDTLCAEAQRRFFSSISVRQLAKMSHKLPPTEVDSIERLSPAIWVSGEGARDSRSTLGTFTEIVDLLRVVFCRAGTIHCHICQKPLHALPLAEMVARCTDFVAGTRIEVLSEIEPSKDSLERARREGFVRAELDGHALDLSQKLPSFERAKQARLVVDRLIQKGDGAMRSRLSEAIELALRWGKGVVIVRKTSPNESPIEHEWSETAQCREHGVQWGPITPSLLSWNPPFGRCERCAGTGRQWAIEPEKLVDRHAKSLADGAIWVWGAKGSASQASQLTECKRQYGIDPHATLQSLAADDQKRVVDHAMAYVCASLDGLLDDDENDIAVGELRRIAKRMACGECGGSRLSAPARSVRWNDVSLADLCALSLNEAKEILARSPEKTSQDRALRPLIDNATRRLAALIELGLGYLPLQRGLDSLSRGEFSRALLAAHFCSDLSGVLVVLDEISAGLSRQDLDPLATMIRALVDRGNSLLLVDHNLDLVRRADWVIDFGPGSGTLGGMIVAEGTPNALADNPASVTGPWISGAKALRRTAKQVAPTRWLSVAHGLKLPLGCLAGFAGPSGSGKSTWVFDVAVAKAISDVRSTRSSLDHVVCFDDAPAGKSRKSTPASYVGLLAEIRQWFASMPLAKVRGYSASRFSFNVKGGRCEACRGQGAVAISLLILPDAMVACEVCGGSRYDRETLEVKYRGYSIADTLAMTIDRALDAYQNVPKIAEKLAVLQSLRLGYLTLGQSGDTLSTGERQRLRLARELVQKKVQPTLYVFDEPSAGLHGDDVQALLDLFFGLRDAGHSIWVIEHDESLLQCLDWRVDFEPIVGTVGGSIRSSAPVASPKA